MKTIHIFGMGFTQTLGANSGQIALWLTARMFGSPEHALLTPMTWRADPKEIANFLNLIADDDTRIFGYFYSWGAGWFFKRLVDRMAELKIGFDTIVLCDPVARSNLMPEWLPLNPTSMMAWPYIKIPKNVKRVHVFHQKVNHPRAHRLKIEDEKVTKLVSDVELRARHEDMEDQPEYHRLVLSIIKEATNEVASIPSAVLGTAIKLHELQSDEAGRDQVSNPIDPGVPGGD